MPLADLLTALLYLSLFKPLTLLFTSKSAVNGILICAGYLLLCIATYQLMLLKPSSGSRSQFARQSRQQAGCLPFLALCFGFVVVVMLFELTGAFDPGGYLAGPESGNSLAGALFGVLVFLAAVAYMFVVILRPVPIFSPGTAAHSVRYLLGIAGSNLMFLLTLAFWDSYFAGAESTGGSLGLHILLFLVFYVLSLMFLAPPRLVLLWIEGGKWGMASFLFWLGLYCWRLTS